MENSKSEILNDLLIEIGLKEFDLEAWKMKATMVFMKFFGPEDEKIGFIKNLRYDFSSWALRDSSGGKQPDSVKENARRIVETALLEISLSKGENLVFDTIQEVLTGTEFSKLLEIVEKSENKASGLNEYFINLTTTKKEQILTNMVLKSIGR